MTVKVSKPAINVREKLAELDFAKVPFQKMPAGSVVQYQSSTTGQSFATTATSFVDSGVDIVFTPKLANSKVLITVQSRRFNLVTADILSVKIVRDDLTDVLGLQNTLGDIHFQNNNSSASNQISVGLHYMWEDTLSSLNEIKYSVYYKVNAGNGYLADTGGVQLYIQEIAQ
mgnify:CR=1 FL=1|jgi:hypothetical protein